MMNAEGVVTLSGYASNGDRIVFAEWSTDRMGSNVFALSTFALSHARVAPTAWSDITCDLGFDDGKPMLLYVLQAGEVVFDVPSMVNAAFARMLSRCLGVTITPMAAS